MLDIIRKICKNNHASVLLVSNTFLSTVCASNVLVYAKGLRGAPTPFEQARFHFWISVIK